MDNRTSLSLRNFLRNASAAFVLTVSAFAFTPVSADANPDVAAVVAKWRSLTGFKARITMGGGSGALSGNLSYSNGRVHLALSDGRIIASTGREMVVYNPGSSVAGKQMMFPGAGGLGWLLTGFKTKVSGNTALLESENPTSNVHEVRIKWGANHLLEQLSIRRRNSNDFTTITLSNIRQIDSFPVSLFSYDPPAGSRTVENPLNQSN